MCLRASIANFLTLTLLQTISSYTHVISSYTHIQGSVTSSIIGFFSGMGDTAKEVGVPEGGCEGVSVVVSVMFFCSHICMVQGKAYHAFSPCAACIQ